MFFGGCFARNLINYLESKILKENPDQNALEFLAFVKGLVLDAYLTNCLAVRG